MWPTVKPLRIGPVKMIPAMNRHVEHKHRLSELRTAMYNFSEDDVRAKLKSLSTRDTVFRLGFPFEDVLGPDAFFAQSYAPLVSAWPDLERRDSIVVAGEDTLGNDWVGCCGNYVGTFCSPWLDIPATGLPTQMRFHEFYRFVDGNVVETHMLWDIPEVMLQAKAWPLVPALGKEGPVPGPADCSGLTTGVIDEDQSQATQLLIMNMINAMIRHPAEGGPEVMQLEKYWHPNMCWYGPSGIGSTRGIQGFRLAHQIPFLNAMPDRGVHSSGTEHHFFSENQFAAVTGWPNMTQTLSHGGWLGLAPTGQRVNLRSLDFWRVEKGLIRENWVLVDLLDVYQQLGIDVFARLREFCQRPSAEYFVGVSA